MLSNFQFGNQSLLQTFLVGQPEFRGILQRPEMEQFRQRVAATCHIGPLDEDETRAYIEHRLKCAGGSGKPSFDAEAFPAIFKASQGIPRRINSLCDRLLLLGFMSNRTHLSLADVGEVLRDIAQESETPKPAAVNGTARHGAMIVNGSTIGAADIEHVDLTRLELSAEEAQGLSGEISALGHEQQTDRLNRLEGSLIRLERINLQTLSLLQRLVDAVSKPH